MMPNAFRRISLLSAFLIFTLPGCSQVNHRRPPPTSAEQAAFRAASIKMIEEAAFSDNPALRMQAIEAFQEAAPQDGIKTLAIELNIENEFPGASFAALLAAGEIGAREMMDLVRTRAEHPNPHVKIGAIFALHRMGDPSRTSELAGFLLQHDDPTVRANAALVIGRLGGKQHASLLKKALRREERDDDSKKVIAQVQILESLAALGDGAAIDRLIMYGYSEVWEQATVGIMALSNIRCQKAEAMLRFKAASKHPEVHFQAVRGLARIGRIDYLKYALEGLTYKGPRPREGEMSLTDRCRSLSALALEAMAHPESIVALKNAFEEPGQPDYVRLAVARAAVRTIDKLQGLDPRLPKPQTVRGPAPD